MSGKPDAPTSPTHPNPKQPTNPHLQIQPLTLLQKKSCAAPYHLRIIFCFNHNNTKSPLPATADEVKRFTDAVAKCPGVSRIKAGSIPDSKFPIEYLD